MNFTSFLWVLHVPTISPSLFEHTSNIWGSVQAIKYLIMEFSPDS